MPLVQQSIVNEQYQALGMDEVARDISNIIDQVNTNTEDIASMSGGSDYTETIVNISSAEILAMGTSPVELLPAAGVNSYYDLEKIVLEYTHVTTAYTLLDLIGVYGNVTTYGLIYDNLISSSEDMSYLFTPIGASDNTGAGYAEKMNKNIVLSTVTSTNPEDGDGTIRVIIYHKTRTFGA